MASGGLWKTTNRGVTWRPIFDQYGSYSIGCVSIDPKNSDQIWLGTGENQSQRSVGFGDGIYKSSDGGQSWAHVGLKHSEHIAKIVIDPRYSDVVYIASQGPLWKEGGDRGLFKTTNGGKSWKSILAIGEHTGVTDVCFDPRDPDVLYAATYQRRRNVGVLIGGGPESGIYKSTDAGKTWEKLTTGLPEKDMGRIALAISPQKPDVVYAHVQTATGKDRGGFFRSEDAGKSWARRGTTTVQDGQYYGEIFADPHAFDRIYIMDMMVQVTNDGGKTFQRQRWSDSRRIIMPWRSTRPMRITFSRVTTAGLYESHDGGKSWRHFDTLSSTQFYRVAVDNAVPFYNVYGGAQDNGSMGGPARTRNRAGIRTSDWGRYGGGDGMQPRVDPTDPDTIYTMLAERVDRSRRSSDRTAARRFDRETPGRTRVRWAWDSAFIVSPHNPKRLYLAGNKLFRSDDRGDNWKAVSPDLTRQLDPSKAEVMGKVWGRGRGIANTFTTPLGLDHGADGIAGEGRTPLRRHRRRAGSGQRRRRRAWRKIDGFPGVPTGTTWVSDLFASSHDPDTVYAAFNNWQRGDFKPYRSRSHDRGKSWEPVAGNLPDRHCVWCVVEDPVNRNLLFAGTEFGLFVSLDGGAGWVRVPVTLTDHSLP